MEELILQWCPKQVKETWLGITVLCKTDRYRWTYEYFKLSMEGIKGVSNEAPIHMGAFGMKFVKSKDFLFVDNLVNP